MKKSLFFAGVTLFMLGTSSLPLITAAKAETLLAVKPVVNQSPKNTSAPTPQVELISLGAEPRQELRFKPAVDAKETASMTVSTDISMSVDGKPIPAFKMPATVVKLDTAVTKVESNGDVNYEFAYSDVELAGETTLPPEAMKTLRSQMAQLKGIKGSVTVDNRGQTKKANLAIPKDVDPSLKQMMGQISQSIKQLSSPVPQQAVGIGAQWRVSSVVNISGISLKQAAIYELVDMKNGVATLNIKVEQLGAPSQKLNLPEVPPGVNVSLKSYTGKGEGKALINLNKLMPISSTLSMKANTLMGATSSKNPKELTMNQDILMQMNIESK
jgi:Family of unknown function (DUF6263)